MKSHYLSRLLFISSLYLGDCLYASETPSTRMRCHLANLQNEIASTNLELKGLDRDVRREFEKIGVRFTELDRANNIINEKLRPIFDTGIVHEAILEELAFRGFVKPKDISNALTLITTMPGDAPLELIEQIASRIVSTLHIGTDISDTKSIMALAKRFKMKPEEMGNLLKTWQKIMQSDPEFEELKGVLLTIIYQDQNDLIKKLTKRRSWGARLARWWKTPSAMAAAGPIPKGEDKLPSALALDKSAIKNSFYLQELSKQKDASIQSYLISQFYKKLTTSELQWLLENKKDIIPPALRKRMIERKLELESFADQIQQLNNQVAANIADLKKTRDSIDNNIDTLERIKTRSVSDLNDYHNSLLAQEKAKLTQQREKQLKKLEEDLVTLQEKKKSILEMEQKITYFHFNEQAFSFTALMEISNSDTGKAIIIDFYPNFTHQELEVLMRSPTFHDLPKEVQTKVQLRLQSMNRIREQKYRIQELTKGESNLKMVESDEIKDLSTQLTDLENTFNNQLADAKKIPISNQRNSKNLEKSRINKKKIIEYLNQNTSMMARMVAQKADKFDDSVFRQHLKDNIGLMKASSPATDPTDLNEIISAIEDFARERYRIARKLPDYLYKADEEESTMNLILREVEQGWPILKTTEVDRSTFEMKKAKLLHLLEEAKQKAMANKKADIHKKMAIINEEINKLAAELEKEKRTLAGGGHNPEQIITQLREQRRTIYDNEKQRLEKEIRKIDEQMANLKTSIETSKSEMNKQMETELTKLKNELEQKKNDLEKQIPTLVKEQETKIAKGQEELASLQRKKAELQQKINDVTSQFNNPKARDLGEDSLLLRIAPPAQDEPDIHEEELFSPPLKKAR